MREFHSQKKIIKMTITVLNCSLKPVRETKSWWEMFFFLFCSRTLPCQDGICTCKSRCITSCKVTGFQICSLGSQESFNILTCWLKSSGICRLLWGPQSCLLVQTARSIHLLVIALAAAPAGLCTFAFTPAICRSLNKATVSLYS